MEIGTGEKKQVHAFSDPIQIALHLKKKMKTYLNIGVFGRLSILSVFWFSALHIMRFRAHNYRRTTQKLLQEQIKHSSYQFTPSHNYYYVHVTELAAHPLNPSLSCLISVSMATITSAFRV